jgi:serine/threonine-protein kinase
MQEEELWRRLVGDLAARGEILAGKYRLDRIVGAGGMGVVFEAWHVDLRQRVAVKLLGREVAADDEARQRLEREARACFRLESPHVARVLDFGATPTGACYLVMEYLEGRDLGTILDTDGRLGPTAAVDLVLQACEILAEAHAVGIVHRDLKPENIFVTTGRDGAAFVKVLDFGVSKLPRSRSRRERSLTRAEATLGTPHYMSPEQWASARDVGPAADLWALGVVLFELLTGERPFEHELFPQLCAKIMNAPPRSLASLRPDLPTAIEAVIGRCLEKIPERRYRDVVELARALAPFASPRGRESVERVAAASEIEPPSSTTVRLGGTLEDVASMAVDSPPDGPTVVRTATELANDPTPARAPAVAALPARVEAQTLASATETSSPPRPAPPSRRGLMTGVVAVGLVALTIAAVALERVISAAPEPQPARALSGLATRLEHIAVAAGESAREERAVQAHAAPPPEPSPSVSSRPSGTPRFEPPRPRPASVPPIAAPAPPAPPPTPPDRKF